MEGGQSGKMRPRTVLDRGAVGVALLLALFAVLVLMVFSSSEKDALKAVGFVSCVACREDGSSRWTTGGR